MRALIPILLPLGLLAAFSASVTATPTVMPFQGVITNAAGEPVATGTAVTFTIRDDTPADLWTATYAVTAVDGVVSLMLGEDTGEGQPPLPADVFADGGDRFLVIAVGDEELAEVRIGSSAYAFHAETADVVTDGLIGTGSTYMVPLWMAPRVLGSSIIAQSGGRIGIGTMAPDRPLEVNNGVGGALIGQCTHSTANDYIGVEGHSVPINFYGIGGRFTGGYHGVEGYSASANSSGGIGVVGGSSSDGGYKYGLYAYADGTGTNYGVYADASGGTTNYAGYFDGNLHVEGTLSKSGGSFRIDHPLDPANMTLSHSFVESPDMMNIYNGNVVLGEDGRAWVELPAWFGALNRDFRYQLTCIGGFAPVYIATKIADNRFQIAGGQPGLEVSWLVTGIRQDAWANQYRIPVEEPKADKDRGRYLNPEAFGQPEEMGVDFEARKAAERR